MHTQLDFFPSSLPGETLYSRISRFHFLKGNFAHRDTYLELFQCSRVHLDLVYPKQIDELAKRVPGDPKSNLACILKQNSLLPLYTPFLGVAENTHTKETLAVIESAERLPMRSQRGTSVARLCVECVKQDLHDHGISYWHTTHQAPHVTTCWRHDVLLRQACPNCSRPFLRTHLLLTIPWFPCDCGWNCKECEPIENLNRHDRNYAMIVRELIVSEISPIPARLLSTAYRSKAHQMGYRAGQFVSHGALRKGIQEEFGKEFLLRVDPNCIDAQKHQFKFNFTKGYSDMPIARHILLIMHLFGGLAAFVQHLAEVRQEDAYLSPPKRMNREQLERRDVYRFKIAQVTRRWPGITMEQLWSKATAATKWLYEYDRQWIVSIGGLSVDTSAEEKAKDEQYSKIIQEKLEFLYSMAKKPIRVNQVRLCSVLPRKVNLYNHFSRKYPLLSDQFDNYIESRWHFNVRRIFWAIGECQRLDINLCIGNVTKTANIPALNARRIVKYYNINFAKILYNFDPLKELQKLGMNYGFEPSINDAE